MVTEQWTDHEWGPSILNRQPNQRLECLHRFFVLKVARCVHLGNDWVAEVDDVLVDRHWNYIQVGKVDSGGVPVFVRLYSSTGVEVNVGWAEALEELMSGPLETLASETISRRQSSSASVVEMDTQL
jgi:hypothetical protein